MARTEKAAFWILVFLLIVGVAAKFYKLEKEVPDFKFSRRAASRERAKPAEAEKADRSAGILDLNRATAEELEGLPGIGKVSAERIAAYRSAQGPFKAKTDLLKVDGITIALYKKIEPHLSVP
ncbi:MAG: hypothetical protein A3A86_01865 [Elusimicrobia bacterium RIFCSPLOWO2_01_FULL_60_11]|nr:MAG: hypothetical protein A3A86_01865 [Elusimicrobia bacterium RIFCSPLOWO2_01_FULL_60_11]